MNRGLTWWMKAVGAFYVSLDIRLVPAINGGPVTAVTRVDPNARTTFAALLDARTRTLSREHSNVV